MSSILHVQFWIACVIFTWYVIFWCLALLGWYVARSLSRERRPQPLSVSSTPDQCPGVSIIRPLKGLDVDLLENIESSFKQDYPKFEVILSVADQDDPATFIVKELFQKYPHVDATLIIGEDVVGVNPKVNNLARPFENAKYDILWVVDSNVRLTDGALGRAVALLDPPESSFVPDKPGKRRIALVHHIPFAFTTSAFLGARMEEVFMNTSLARIYLALNALAIQPCVIGKSNLYRKSDISRLTATFKPPYASKSQSLLPPPRPGQVTGLAAFGRFLAEDNALTVALWRELDVRFALSSDVAVNVIGDMNLSGYISRRIRWVRVRKHMLLAATFIFEPLSESVLLGLLSAWAAHILFSLPYWIFLLGHFFSWLSFDLDILSSLSGEPFPRVRFWTFLQTWVCRELSAFPIWLVAVLGNEVDWRGQKYRVNYPGVAVKVERSR